MLKLDLALILLLVRNCFTLFTKIKISDRKKIASDSLYKSAMRQPDELRVKPRKNLSVDVFGTKKARIHLGRQGKVLHLY